VQNTLEFGAGCWGVILVGEQVGAWCQLIQLVGRFDPWAV